MNTGNKWLDGMHNHASDLESISRQLNDLARAFLRVGNETTSLEMSELAQDIQTQADKSRELTGGKVNGDYREAVASSGNVLRAVLAGTQLNKTPKGV